MVDGNCRERLAIYFNDTKNVELFYWLCKEIKIRNDQPKKKKNLKCK